MILGHPILRSYGTPLPTDGLIAYYPFHGNANDESGNGYNLTVSGPTLVNGRKGASNEAYEFRLRAVSTADYLLYNSFSLSWQTELTVSFWIYLNEALPSFGRFADLNRSNGDFIAFAYYSGFGGYYCYIQGNSKAKIYNYSTTLNTGQWYHIVFTNNLQDVEMYVNGSIVNRALFSDNSPDAFTVVNSKLVIGNEIPSGNNKSSGKIYDDFRVYNRVLTTDEITALYNE